MHNNVATSKAQIRTNSVTYIEPIHNYRSIVNQLDNYTYTVIAANTILLSQISPFKYFATNQYSTTLLQQDLPTCN